VTVVFEPGIIRYGWWAISRPSAEGTIQGLNKASVPEQILQLSGQAHLGVRRELVCPL
jgi:hypothetical protein